MLNPDEEFIIDGVAHAYNLSPSNYADVASAQPISELTYLIGGKGAPDPIYNVPHDVYVDDWAPEDIANVLFKETSTTMAVAHTLPLYCFKDGMCSAQKLAEFVRRWPHRFRAYAAIDPLRDDWRESLDRQVELFLWIGVQKGPP